MFLKNEYFIGNFLIIIFFLTSLNAYSITNNKIGVLNYLNSIQNFSASFLQNDGENLSEGKIYIGVKRVRAEYYSPTKILIILDENKAMYFNYDVEEEEFFNPKNTNAWFFYEIFRNPLFFEDGLIEEKNKELILEKRGVDNEGKKFLIRLYFEESPLILRGLEVIVDDETLKLSIYDHNYNEEFNKDFFKLISPKFLN